MKLCYSVKQTDGDWFMEVGILLYTRIKIQILVVIEFDSLWRGLSALTITLLCIYDVEEIQVNIQI